MTIIARTREKLEKLEAVVAELEQQLAAGRDPKKRPARRKTTEKPN